MNFEEIRFLIKTKSVYGIGQNALLPFIETEFLYKLLGSLEKDLASQKNPQANYLPKMSTRSFNCLKSRLCLPTDCTTIDKILAFLETVSDKELLRLRYFGMKSLKEVRCWQRNIKKYLL